MNSSTKDLRSKGAHMSMGGHAAIHAQKGGSWDAISRERASAHYMQVEGGSNSIHYRKATHSCCNRKVQSNTAVIGTWKGGTSAWVMHKDSKQARSVQHCVQWNGVRFLRLWACANLHRVGKIARSGPGGVRRPGFVCKILHFTVYSKF